MGVGFGHERESGGRGNACACGAGPRRELVRTCARRIALLTRYTLRLFNKTATKIPETLWLSHVPLPLADLEAPAHARLAPHGARWPVLELRKHS